MDKRKAVDAVEAMYKYLSQMVDELQIVDLQLKVKLLSGDVIDVAMNDRRRVGFGHNLVNILRAYDVEEYPKTSLRFDVHI